MCITRNATVSSWNNQEKFTPDALALRIKFSYLTFHIWTCLLFCYTNQIDHNFNDESYKTIVNSCKNSVKNKNHCILGKMSKTVTIQGEKFVMDSKGKTLHRVNKGTVVTFPQ